ncbi:MAG: hypothetical protein IPK74_38760 [Deltaproteobacteria bacterium]|nr:hypothetical protein [Deltaproteobacteria bacterium]
MALSLATGLGSDAPTELGDGVAAALAHGGVAARTFAAQGLNTALAVMSAMGAVVIAIVIVAAAASGRLGAIDPGAAAGLELPPRPARLRVAIVAVALSLGVGAVVVMRARIAGAARAADASPEALVALWRGSAGDTLMAIGLALLAIAAFELWQSRRDLELALLEGEDRNAARPRIIAR